MNRNRKLTPMDIANHQAFEYDTFARLGFSTDEAHSWIVAGFSFRTAPVWRDAGFTAVEAKEWREVSSDRSDPILPSEAKSARANGETPVTYRRNRNRRYPQPMRTR